MDSALKTLFYPLEKGLLGAPAKDAKILFLGAQHHPALESYSNLTNYQIFKPYAAQLEARGHNVETQIPSDKDFDAVFILLPKNRTEALGLLAHGLNALKTGGLILCAADNKAGGTRIKKLLGELGIENPDDTSKNKARAAWALKQGINTAAVTAAIQSAAFQKILGGEYISQPGIFGWDKIDKGSALLTQTIPSDLKGHGADFGCGYGYLSRFALENCPDIKSLTCIDADHRAIDAAAQNLCALDSLRKQGTDNSKTNLLWADLTTPQTGLKNLDFILMNPPFHEGKKTSADLGVAFIKTAAASLKKNGALYMVANTQLPYETILEEHFFSYEKTAQQGGFKVFKAVK